MDNGPVMVRAVGHPLDADAGTAENERDTMKRMTISLELLHDMFVVGAEVKPHRITEGLEERWPLLNTWAAPDGSLVLEFDDGAEKVTDAKWIGEVI